MDLLRILTLIYIAILVLALAVSLITILVFLRRISKNLGQVQDKLQTVRELTQPLAGPIGMLKDVAGGAANGLSQTKDQLTRADGQLAMVADQSGSGKLKH